MFAKLATVLGLFAIAAQVAVAAPPACLIAAVNTQDDPSDLKTVCSSGASEVQSYMSKNCGNNLSTASSAWTSYCKDAGVTVSSMVSSSSSAASSASGTGTVTSSGSLPKETLVSGSASSGFATATASGSRASGTTHAATATQSGSMTPTGAAARLGMDIVGLAAVGVFGAMLAF